MRRTPWVALVGLALVASGCASSDDTGSGEGVEVAAAFYPLEYVAARVLGPHGEVTGLTTPGKEPHDLELTIKETADIASADLVVYEDGFQAAIDDAIAQNAAGEVLDAAAVVGLQPFADESALDPHFWLDPLRMATLGEAIADSLSGLDTAHAEEYATNAAELRSDLERLDEQFTEGLASCERTTIVVSHDAFGYYARYGLTVAPVAGLSPEAEPTPADLGVLQKLIREEGITTVFSERLVSPRLTQTLAEDMGVETAVLDPIEGLSDETSAEDYLTLMEQNLEALRKSNACQ